MLGKIEGRRGNGWQRMRWLDDAPGWIRRPRPTRQQCKWGFSKEQWGQTSPGSRRASRESRQTLVVAVQSLSRVPLFMTPWTAVRQASLSFTIWTLLKLISIESVMPFNHLIFCRSILLLSMLLFSNESALCIRWPKYWSFSFSTSPSNEYSGLISFRIDWFDLLAVQGTLRSLLQHHSSKASICQHSAFFMVQLS